MLRIKLTKSPIGYSVRQKRTVQALGLGKLNSTTLKSDTPQIRGMVRKVSHLVQMEQVEEQTSGGSASETG